MNPAHITVDDLDHLEGILPRRERHRLAHHLTRRLHYATTSPERAPAGLRAPHGRAAWAALPVEQRAEILTGHLVRQWIELGHAPRRQELEDR
ncbi:hypothetical protein [Microbacterium testaceum]|uniref:hypothetical protein n=1 Tax=Microbacterium testaceum TaxID=2033 RepID=UPI002436010E|nr:hypothetical protein [Microbacterium testaceum]